jgi:predicted metal-dependent peptidase
MDPVEAERQRLASHRMAMLEGHPFWGYLLMQVKLIPAPDLPAFMVTDGVRNIWFNPHLTRHLSSEELGFVLAHQIAHQFLLTEPRRLGRDPFLWSQATDYVINRLVLDIPDPEGSGAPMYEPPEGEYPEIGLVRPLIEPKFKRLVAEAIYARLPAPEGVPLRLDLKLPMSETATGESEPRKLGPSESGAESTLVLSAVMDHGGGLDLHIPVLLDDEDRESLRDRIAQAAEYHTAAECRGHVPLDLLRALRLSGPARVPWQRVLYRYMDRTLSRDDYSRTRPNRKYWVHDVVVPGLAGEQVESIVVAIDTSGSMTADLLIRLVREIRELARNTAELTLIVADAEVHHVVLSDDIDPWLQDPELPGGGGTDHRPVFRWMEERDYRPTVFIGLTDLESEFPSRPPGFPVLWLVPPEHAEPPWGTCIVVDEK